jgi:hypothetical protein
MLAKIAASILSSSNPSALHSQTEHALQDIKRSNKESEELESIQNPSEKRARGMDATIEKAQNWYNAYFQQSENDVKRTVASEDPALPQFKAYETLSKNITDLRKNSVQGLWELRNFLTDVQNGKHGQYQKDALRNMFKEEIRDAIEHQTIRSVPKQESGAPYFYLYVGINPITEQPSLVDFMLHQPRHIMHEGHSNRVSQDVLGHSDTANHRLPDEIPGTDDWMATEVLDQFAADAIGISTSDPRMGQAREQFVAQFERDVNHDHFEHDRVSSGETAIDRPSAHAQYLNGKEIQLPSPRR